MTDVTVAEPTSDQLTLLNTAWSVTGVTTSAGAIGMFGDGTTDAYFFWNSFNADGNCWWGGCDTNGGMMYQMGDTSSDWAGVWWYSDSFSPFALNTSVEGTAVGCTNADMVTTPSSVISSILGSCKDQSTNNTFSNMTYKFHGVMTPTDSTGANTTADSALISLMRQTALTETADGTGTDSVVRIESGRALYGYYFGPNSTDAANTVAVSWNETLTGGTTSGASYLAAGLAIAASVSLMAF